MNKTKIDWADSTWNPVTGCFHDCEYCYARRMANRFGKKLPDRSGYSENGLHCLDSRIDGNPYPYLFEPTLHAYRLDDPVNWTKPRTIFVCSMADLFGKWVPDEWIEQVFEVCAKAPQHRYLFLTKNPKRYVDLANAGKLPQRDNMWYGTTVTDPDTPFFWADNFYEYNTFLSIEPLLACFPADDHFPIDHVKWIIIGAESGNRAGKVTPKKEWIDEICQAAGNGTAVFFKESLIPIVGKENMRCEFPW